QKTDFHRSEHQKRKDEICPFSSLADFNPLQLTKSQKNSVVSSAINPARDYRVIFLSKLPTRVYYLLKGYGICREYFKEFLQEVSIN
ncbi:TPA: hypothetical protein ACL737_002192, partial [Streptococcus pneumoniae]